MGYEDRDETTGEPDAQMSTAQLALSAAVRLIGVAVLCVGLWAGIKVIVEAWALYEQPQRIERLAAAIQAGSNLDGLIGNLVAADAQEGEVGDAAADARRAEPGGTLRLSYFAAWFIALLLMFVIGTLAMTAVTTGGQLALYDLQVKRYSRAVIKEVRRMR
jgi:hypothetical protein